MKTTSIVSSEGGCFVPGHYLLMWGNLTSNTAVRVPVGCSHGLGMSDDGSHSRPQYDMHLLACT